MRCGGAELGTRASDPQMNSLAGGGRRKPPLFGTGAPVRRPKGLSRALAAFGGAQSAPLTDLSVGAFRSLFQIMAARGLGGCVQRASAIQIANPMRLAREDNRLVVIEQHAVFEMVGERARKDPSLDVAAF